MSGAIDTLEVQVPGEELWSSDLRRVCGGRISESGPLLQRQGWRYRGVVDLRQHGFSAVLYLASTVCGSNKLVVKQVGALPYKHLLNEIGALFDGDILGLNVKRIDMAVDVVGYPVGWFRDHVSVRRRQCRGEFGTVSYRTDVRRGVETLYFGRRPNLFRIYDKIAQPKPKAIKGTDWVLFKPDRRGMDSGLAVTRIERQYGGDRVPDQLATLGKIRVEGLKINPFGPLEFSAMKVLSIPADLRGTAFLKALGMRTLVENLGLQGAVAELNRRTGGKGRRYLRTVQSYATDDEPVAPPNLHAMYRQSLAAQLNCEPEANERLPSSPGWAKTIGGKPLQAHKAAHSHEG